jgi:hypothetical protein
VTLSTASLVAAAATTTTTMTIVTAIAKGGGREGDLIADPIEGMEMEEEFNVAHLRPRSKVPVRHQIPVRVRQREPMSPTLRYVYRLGMCIGLCN